MASANLVLFGGAESNSFVRRVADRLPVRIADGKLALRGRIYDGPGAAVKFIYPNPVNPDRYVVVNCAVSPEGLGNIDQFARSQPDWLVFDDSSAADRAGRRAPGYVEGGFFDSDWK